MRRTTYQDRGKRG